MKRLTETSQVMAARKTQVPKTCQRLFEPSARFESAAGFLALALFLDFWLIFGLRCWQLVDAAATRTIKQSNSAAPRCFLSTRIVLSPERRKFSIAKSRLANQHGEE